jgi:hypothetical protein
VGLDKIRKEALIKAAASDIAGVRRRNQRDAPPPVLDIDTEIPNADVKVTEVEDWSNPDNPSVPEVRLGMSIVANDDKQARDIVDRILLLTEDNGKQRLWPTVLMRIMDEIDDSDSKEYDESKYIRFVTLNPKP